jgi:hypothetical protein
MFFAVKTVCVVSEAIGTKKGEEENKDVYIHIYIVSFVG